MAAQNSKDVYVEAHNDNRGTSHINFYDRDPKSGPHEYSAILMMISSWFRKSNILFASVLNSKPEQFLLSVIKPEYVAFICKPP